ncbi:MAG: adenosylmethionine--8-amino-7-oxononanoate transaminase [Holosporales bacterium]|jgi:adenosylmethionine-8-amino-7-oxononanoate aminotransferase|nr:adenosylmethionine--8-amino-7-oxononanoate transaminase [Holosporales bacterium]
MIWRPFTQEKTTHPAIKVKKGEGAYLWAEDGEKYLDMISSWWVTIHGHAQQEIAHAIYHQACTLEHVIFAEFSHDPAETLVKNLKKNLPAHLCKFFFSDDGSTAVEVALKMAYQYFQNQGMKERKLFLSLEGGYHGDTFGAMSAAGKNSQYHATFSELFFNTASVEAPEFYTGVQAIEEKENRIIQELHEKLSEIGHTISALIVEPLIQGAAGMRLYRLEFLEALVKTVRQYGILVIFDEVMTGFYRTGKMFALDYTQIIPDFLCLSKGLTGGFLPLALTVTTKKVYEAFLSKDPQKAFLHGHSYTANPIACVAACKSLEILLRQETQQRIAEIAQFHKNSFVKNVHKRRTLGTISAFDVSSYEEAHSLANAALQNGILLRPLGNTLYLLPPYCVTDEELAKVYDVINKYL